MLADLVRSTDNARRAMVWNDRKARQTQHFQQWATKQAHAGRNAKEITWGNCVKETGVLREGR